MSNNGSIQITEEYLIQGLQQQNTSVLRVLYEKYSASLYGVICRIVSDEHIAEDILQEAFVKIWNNAASYDIAKGRLFTWMLNICRNSAIDKMRSKGYKTTKRTAGEETIDHHADQNLYNDIKPETIGIKDIVNTLKPEWKVIVDLIYFNGYTHLEVSEELNIPLGTVKTRLRSAIIHLRELI